jgi:hypothetical protein
MHSRSPRRWILAAACALLALPVLAADTGARPGTQLGGPPPRDPVAPAAGVVLAEGFDDVTTLPGAGWEIINHSNPVGLLDWYQGVATVFPAHAGAPTAYIATNYNSTAGTGTISDWLLTPEIPFPFGELRFWTRTATGSSYPDRLQVRLSTNGASNDVGTTESDVGDFTTLLLDVNPTLALGGYPEVWTEFVVGPLPGAGSGRIAFRYYVTSGGPSGANSNYIGVDTVSYAQGALATQEIPTLGVWGLAALVAFLGLFGALALHRRRAA